MKSESPPVWNAWLVSAILPILMWPALLSAGLAPAPSASQPRDEGISGQVLHQQVEEDWLKQAQAIDEAVGGAVSTETDARGGCDGIKNGKYAFHTGQEPNPWWQVDLGEVVPISRVVVFNRLDYAPGLHNADNLRILTSDDGKQWILRQENKGKHFGGISGGAPLEVRFKDDEVRGRFVRLQIPSAAPIFLHLDEVEVYGTAAPKRNLALHQPANQSSLSQWSTAKPLSAPNRIRQYPTAAFIERGRKLAADLQQAGVDCAPALRSLDDAAQHLQALPKDASDDLRRAAYLQARWAVRGLVFANPGLDFDRLLFVKRFTQETYPDVCLNHMPWCSRPGGDLCILSAAKGQKLSTALAAPGGESNAGTANLRSILNRALGPGHVHGMDLWWDGSRVVFGYARTPTDEPPEGWIDRARSYHFRRTVEPTHLFEIGIDGRNLRQLTSGEWSDLDPTYTAGGDIVFVSERCGTSLQCNEYDKDETSCNLYVMKPDGTGIRRLSANKDGDYLPHTLDDGTVGYLRWEYHERSWAFIQSIWTIRPDGTGADALFKQHFVNPWSLEDVRSVPGSKKLVCIAAGHHTLAAGPVVVVDPAIGINEPKGMSIVTPDVKPPEGGMDGVPALQGGTHDGGGFYSTPWALSEKCFLAAYTYSNKEIDAKGYALYVIDVFGNKELLLRDPAISCFMPMPLRARPRPPVFPEFVDLSKDHATCIISDVSFGSEEIADRIRYVRIAEPIGWPYDNQLGGQRYGEKGPHLINWTPIRILGDVPVERDGSAHFEVPADTAVYFQLLDENRMELRRMRSFISFQPGETRACAGCHETRGLSPRSHSAPLAASLPPRALIPPPWGNRPVSFLRDIQPILDRHCVQCHGGLKPAGGLDFCGGLTDWSREYEQAWGLVPGYGFNRAFETILRAKLVATAEPNLQDASVTPPLAYGAHASKLFKALDSPAQRQRGRLTADELLRMTMWMDANAPYHDRFVNKRATEKAYDIASDKVLAKQITAVQERRCASCHKTSDVSRLDWIDLQQPDHTLFLRAPLNKSAGGSQSCQGTVYKDARDPDYVSLRELVAAAVKKAWASPRRDLQTLVAERLAATSHLRVP
jgi:Hydrazine synthase alpha subunit middle domain/F5/8 type C domain